MYRPRNGSMGTTCFRSCSEWLLGDELIGRVDLKADRAAGRLLVQRLTWEVGRGGISDRAALTDELDELASWLDVSRA